MEGNPPKTNQELLEALGGPVVLKSEARQQVADNVNGATLPNDVVSGLSADQLAQWIDRTSRQCGVNNNGLGRMLVTQLALVNHQIGRLIERHDIAEVESMLVPWTNAVVKLMSEFRRAYFALCKLQDMRERKRRRRSKKRATAMNGKSHRKNGAGNFLERQQLNTAN